MSTTNNNKTEPNPRPDLPLLRMLHPTSGRENYNDVRNRILPPTQPTVDPQLAAMIRWQTQQAIANSAAPNAFPYQNFSMPQYSPYMYGIYQPYSYYQPR